MVLMHSVRHKQHAKSCNPTMLCFLGKNMTPLGGGPQYPCVICINSERVSIPRNTLIGNILQYGRNERYTESLPTESRAFLEDLIDPRDHLHVRGIEIPRRPERRPNQPGPNSVLRGRHIKFVSNVDRAIAGFVMIGPFNGKGLSCHRFSP